jgi:hypothetical protein
MRAKPKSFNSGEDGERDSSEDGYEVGLGFRGDRRLRLSVGAKLDLGPLASQNCTAFRITEKIDFREYNATS